MTSASSPSYYLAYLIACVTLGPMDWDLRLQRAPDIEITEVVDGFVVQRRDHDRLHFLNPTAAFVLEICDGSLPAGALPDLVAAAFQLDQPPRDDVETCLRALLKEGLLLGPPAPGPG